MTAVRLTKNYDAAQAGEILRRGTQRDREALRRDLIEHKAVVDLEINALKARLSALRKHGEILERFMRDAKWRLKNQR